MAAALIPEAAELLREAGHPLHADAVEDLARQIAALTVRVDNLTDLAGGIAADALALIAQSDDGTAAGA